LQTALWPPKFKPVSLSKYNGFGNSSSSWGMNQLWIQQEEMMSRWSNSSSLSVKVQFWIGTLYYNHIQSTVGSIWRPSSFKHSRYFTKQRPSH
jgi:hypothetical protein